MKILLIKVGLREYNHYQYSPPTVLALLSGQLKKKCVFVDDINIIDAGVAFRKVEDLVQVLDDYRPDVVGLSCYSFNYDLLLKYASLIKQYSSAIKVIVGGPIATLEYKKLIYNTNLDFMVIGEGEKTLCELINAISEGSDEFSKINGLAYRRNNDIFVTSARPFCNDLSEIYSHIDHESINYDDYEGLMTGTMFSTGKNASILTGRGCPYRCAYCHSLNGRKVRKRTVENVIKEIEWLIENKNLKNFYIDDDIFNFNKNWAMQFCKIIIDRKYDISLFFHNGLRADIIDEELIDLLLEAGTSHFRFAIETASPRLQKLTRKNLNLDKALNAIKYASNTSAITDVFFLLGIPTETEEELDSTLSLIEETGIFHPVINFLQIFPGTYMEEIYNKSLQNKKDPPDSAEIIGKYTLMNDNNSCYSVKLLKKKFIEMSRKIYRDPKKVALAYEKLSFNLKDDDVKIYFGLTYGLPNKMELTLNDLPDNTLGRHLKKLARESLPLISKSFGATTN